MRSGREETLTALHTAATEIQECDSVESACERTMDAAEEVLEFTLSCILLHEDGWLEPVAVSAGAPEDGVRRMADDQGLAGKTFQTGQSRVVADVTADTDSDPAKASYLSGISVPVGEAGVFQAVAEERDAFDDADVELAELLVDHTARTIDRIRYERELQARKAALERNNERLESFVNTVSHDLRNPLNVATGRLSLARGECDSDHLDDVAAAHERMEALIEDILTLAREGRPVEETETEPVELGELVRAAWDTVATEDATLEVDVGGTLTADRGRLRRLLENLLRNAVEHGGEAVTVTVGAAEGPEGFYVADDGPGVPPGQRDHVFDRGYSAAEDGTGFGLAIVEEIATAHGWTVSVTESEAGGARFTVRPAAGHGE
jgi:signal transduction histidine kinase